MTIPESKFEDWKGTGADKSSSIARRQILNALRGERSPLKQKKDEFDVRLQGSYANTTHTYGSSDVDVIAKLTSSWRYDLDELNADEEERFWNYFDAADYTYRDFYEDVYTALKIKFGVTNVTRGNKSLKVSSDEISSLPVDVDVVPCSEYRVYHTYPKCGDPTFSTGMYFHTRIENAKIINFPRYHRENGAEKNQRTGKKYKETIRIFKNARDYAGDKPSLLFANGDTASYYIECVLYNVPDDLFTTTRRNDRFIHILEHLEDRTEEFHALQQQSEMMDLFGSDETQWEKTNARQFLHEMRQLWDGWPH